jgi:hypothetical protein
MRVIFLDIDGVMNRTGYRPRGESRGLRSWIEPELAARLVALAGQVGAELVMSSDWRSSADLAGLRAELAAAGITTPLAGITPVIPGERWCEIRAWLDEHAVADAACAIIDDLWDMGPLAPRFVRISPLAGLDEAAAARVAALFA